MGLHLHNLQLNRDSFKLQDVFLLRTIRRSPRSQMNIVMNKKALYVQQQIHSSGSQWRVTVIRTSCVWRELNNHVPQGHRRFSDQAARTVPPFQTYGMAGSAFLQRHVGESLGRRCCTLRLAAAKALCSLVFLLTYSLGRLPRLLMSALSCFRLGWCPGV